MISFDLFEEKYKPVFNTIGENEDSIMFETYGEEFEFVKNSNPKCVWTIVEEDSQMIIIPGMHLVNRIGYIITEIENNEDVSVCYDAQISVDKAVDLAETFIKDVIGYNGNIDIYFELKNIFNNHSWI